MSEGHLGLTLFDDLVVRRGVFPQGSSGLHPLKTGTRIGIPIREELRPHRETLDSSAGAQAAGGLTPKLEHFK